MGRETHHRVAELKQLDNDIAAVDKDRAKAEAIIEKVRALLDEG